MTNGGAKSAELLRFLSRQLRYDRKHFVPVYAITLLEERRLIKIKYLFWIFQNVPKIVSFRVSFNLKNILSLNRL